MGMDGAAGELRYLPPVPPEQAVERLAAMQAPTEAEQAEMFHREADHLLLRVLRHVGQEAVVAAYLEARRRVKFRYG